MQTLYVVPIIIAYLFGSINGAIIISRLMKLPSPQKTGSGNPGATNVLRSGNKKAALLTLFFDLIKGVIPLLIAIFMHMPPAIIALTGLFAVIGHMYPVFFGFKGGKGVATTIGIVLAISPLLALFVIVSFLIVLGISRYVSLASIVSALLCPVYAYFILPFSMFPSFVIIALLICHRHHSNIKRIIAGNEHKLGKKKNNC